tara:strand:+ start:7282 stop:7695 length:414 start_codon:yes stop_codon:yes gene_type:complete
MATKKITTTNGELVDLMNGLFNVQDLKGKGFALKVHENMKSLQQVLEPVEEASKPTEEFVKFAQDVQKLQQSKDSEGVQKLEESNPELVNARKVQLEKVQEMLKIEAKEIELQVFTKEMLPKDISGRQVTNLEKIII